jgi:hypothetical protein
MSEFLTPEHFKPHVDKVFRVKGGRHTLILTQVDVRHMRDWEAAVVPRQPFTLIFSGPPGDVLSEGPHVLEVENGPSFELYIIPIHTLARDRQEYQAAFN